MSELTNILKAHKLKDLPNLGIDLKGIQIGFNEFYVMTKAEFDKAHRILEFEAMNFQELTNDFVSYVRDRAHKVGMEIYDVFTPVELFQVCYSN